jgi:uncharacterized membrane protein
MSEEVSDRPTTTDEQPAAVDEAIITAPTDEAAIEEKADAEDETDSHGGCWSSRLRGIVHPATLLTLAGVVAFTIVFGRLGVIHHRNFASWSYDMGIYDQGFWLVSRGGQSFVTVRGLEFWGHHVNLVAVLFAPFYRLGAGPSFLYVAQAFALGLGALPVYLIARDRFGRPWVGLAFAAAYLMYAPVQWISSANFHPEALVITPFLFAWYFARRRSWGWYFVAVGFALSTREDTAMAVFVLGIVLLVLYWRSDDRRDRHVALATIALGVVWYAVCTQVVIPYFNDGRQPFYLESFYGSYGGSIPEIATNIVRNPDQVASDATQPDRLRFYRDLVLPFGGLPLAAPLELLMAGPQMLASVIGASPYARMIRYQYTAVMIAPIVIAAIEGARWLWRYRIVRLLLIPWLLAWACWTNVAWSPSPVGAGYSAWVTENPRVSALREAVATVPDDVSVSATYTLLPHLAHREEVYDWPNPFEAAYWGNDDRYRLPDPSTIDYLVVDRQQVGPNRQARFADLTDGDPFEIVFDRDDVVVAKRAVGAN